MANIRFVQVSEKCWVNIDRIGTFEEEVNRVGGDRVIYLFLVDSEPGQFITVKGLWVGSVLNTLLGLR